MDRSLKRPKHAFVASQCGEMRVELATPESGKPAKLVNLEPTKRTKLRGFEPCPAHHFTLHS